MVGTGIQNVLHICTLMLLSLLVLDVDTPKMLHKITVANLYS